MLMRNSALVASCLFLVLSGSLLRAADVEVIKRGKAATAMVKRDERATLGSAFCIAPEGLFVTSQMVAAQALVDGRVMLVLNPNDEKQAKVRATIVHEDKAADIALLKTENDGPYVALEPGNLAGLTETQEVLVFGYQAGVPAPALKSEYSSVVVEVRRISSLHKRDGVVQALQLDGMLQAGFAGGPVLDAAGKAIGVVPRMPAARGFKLAVPITQVSAMMKSPRVAFDPRPVPAARARDAQLFEIQVESIAKPDDLVVEMTLGGANAPGGPRHYTAEPLGSAKYRVKAPLVAGPGSLFVRATFANGHVEGQTADRDIQLSGGKVRLSQLAQIEGDRVTLAGGMTHDGRVTGLDALSVDMGGAGIQIDGSLAKKIEIEAGRMPTAVHYEIRVKNKEGELALVHGEIPLEVPAPQPLKVAAPPKSDLPSPPSVSVPVPAEAAASPPDSDRKSIQLPGAVDDVIVAGAGRYLLLQINNLRQLLVFDLDAAKIVKFLPLPRQDVLVAGGLDRIITVVPGQNVLQSHNLQTFERELTVALADATEVGSIAFGHASTGPFLLITPDGSSFWDARTLSRVPVEVKGDRHWDTDSRRAMRVAASADGRTFAAWRTQSSPSGMFLMTLSGNQAQVKYEHQGAGELLPSTDGSLLFSGQGVYSATLHQLGRERFSGLQCLPAIQAGYFVGVRNPFYPTPDNRAPTSTLSVFTVDDQQLLFTLTNLEELKSDRRDVFRLAKALPLSRRIFFAPDAKLLVTLAPSADQLYLRRVDTMAQLDKADIDYLFVSSLANRLAEKGKPYEYAVKVESKRGGVKFKLQSAPEGMQLADDGVLRWDVPADAKPDADVILSISDASSREIFHAFNIQVR